jgi:hypothetical protein
LKPKVSLKTGEIGKNSLYVKMKFMKKTFTAIAIAAVFAACNSKPKTDTAISTPGPDTAAMNQALRDDNAQTTNMNGVSDTIFGSDGSQYVKVQPGQPAALVPVAKAPVRKTSTSSRTRTKAGSGSASSGATSSSAGESETASTPVPAKKKGWSKAAKGAAIGAGSGAVAGAIISKKKGKGAVIGGVIGGAGGYIIGRSKDKKDGRY